jgi:AraC-like DNA-binding protein
VLHSRTFAPNPELAPYIRRHYVFESELPDDFQLLDSLISETAFVRILIRGKWAGQAEDGVWSDGGQALLLGANSRPFAVRVTGSFTIWNFAIRPSGWKALFGQSAQHFADKMVPLSEVWGETADTLLAAMRRSKSDEACVAAIEEAVRTRIQTSKRPKVDNQMAEFESIARIDSTTRVHDAADRLGLSSRQLERRCLDSFGLSPKTVLRRSRFLDMATAIRGFSTPSEDELASLRYFDQSHLNREFWDFAGMPPGAFAKSITPLFTAGLKLRHEGKSVK